MIANLKNQNKSVDHALMPLQPMGWPVYALRNAAIQGRQEAEAQQRRADRLAARNRRLRATTAGALAVAGTVGLAMLAIGVLLGYAVGTGLLRAVGP